MKNQPNAKMSIPGKCVFCSDIDSYRSNTSDKAVLEALKQCHAVHRGGFIMPERMR
jgi:hypothetical protein